VDARDKPGHDELWHNAHSTGALGISPVWQTRRVASHAAAYVSIEPAIPNDGRRCSRNGGLGDEQQKIGLDRQSILANSLVVAASNIGTR
jgi:hypothetical protein